MATVKRSVSDEGGELHSRKVFRGQFDTVSIEWIF